MRTLIHHPDAAILGMAVAVLGLILTCGLLAPPLFGPVVAICVAGGGAFLILRFPIWFCTVWLLVTGISLEMAMHDLVGEAAYQPTIAAVKGAEIALALLAAIRFGATMDLLCPAWAFPAMFATGLAHGLFPGLGLMDSLRSAIGSAVPFAFCFCRMPRSWAEAMIRTTKWCPIVAVTACLPLTATGIRPLFVESGGWRLGGLGHPAFLAGVCLPAIYACLIQLYRQGRRGDLALLLVNGLILLLTGARAPAAYAVMVGGISLLTIRSTIFPARDRLILMLAALALLPVLVVLAGDLDQVRLFNVAVNETANLSGRGLLWPKFEDAAAGSPWFGWGTGAGNAVIPPDGPIARTLHTWAAHNEYLRLRVEGGLFGEILLIGLFAAWGIVHTRALPASDRRIMRLALLALAAHAATDNVLISTPACVFFAFTSAVFARGTAE